jgi:Mrp family chromosome partitioning ATPase
MSDMHSDFIRKPDAQSERMREAVERRMQQIRHKLVVLSGKGGVGKSTVAANLAFALAAKGLSVGLLDVDVHGPSIPTLTGMEGCTVQNEGNVLLPLRARENLWVMSIGFLLAQKEDAVIWRGPLKFHLIRQFLGDVQWGNLDYLVIDCPPGTGDEPLSVVQLVGKPASALIVTTPQRLSIGDVRRCVTFCHKTALPVTGIIENMSGFVCPHCGAQTDIFNTGGGQELASEMDVPFLGRIPIDPSLVTFGDHGLSLLDGDRDTPTAIALTKLVGGIEQLTATSARA